jgi:major vault protein
LKRGEDKFFVQPGEVIYDGIKSVMVVHEDQAILLKAIKQYYDKRTETKYLPGQTWMIQGPLDFIPDKEVEVVEKRQAVPLAENEGLYIRNLKNGEVKLVKGPQTYLLNENEQLWEKILTPQVEELLAQNNSGSDYVPAQQDANGKITYV